MTEQHTEAPGQPHPASEARATAAAAPLPASAAELPAGSHADLDAPARHENAAGPRPPFHDSSNVPSYCHTPTEPYIGNASSIGSKPPLQLAPSPAAAEHFGQGEEGEKDVALDAAVAALQAEIGGASMVPGSVWYLVAREWYAAWQESTSGLLLARVGEIDNTPVVDARGELLPDLKLGEELEAVPEHAWAKMVLLFGLHGQGEIRRIAVQGEPGKVMLDLYPPTVYVTNVDKRQGSETRAISISLAASFAELKRQIASVFKIPQDRPDAPSLPLFKLNNALPPKDDSTVGTEAQSPATEKKSQGSDDTSPGDLPPSYEAATALDDHADSAFGGGSDAAASAPAASRKFVRIAADDTVTLMAAGILPDSIVAFTLPPASCTDIEKYINSPQDINAPSSSSSPSSSDSGLSDNEASANPHDYLAASRRAQRYHNALSSPASDADSGTEADSSVFGSSGYAADTSSRTTSVVLSLATPSRPESHYLCGLNNLGNTCFMNSALQCLGHISELTQYFVSNVYTSELNRENPLGMKGAVASAYGRLAKAMWEIGRGAYAPRAFKQTIAQWAPQFRGYNQQDAPEFLAFLLDGMHEDLNRIVHKPYIEVPDANGRPDREVADEQWGIYKQRNDSVVVDLFQGQYKSTLVCPVCDKVSVTFDPFMYLTLPLPVQRQKWIDVTFVPKNHAIHATRMHLLVRKDDTVKQLKQMVAHLKQTELESLLACDVTSDRIYTIYADADPLAEISDTDAVIMYELGVDVSQVAASPESVPEVVIQLACSKASGASSYGSYHYSYGPNLISKPLIVTLPASELTLGDLYLQIATALSRWTTVDMSRLIAQLNDAYSGTNNDSGSLGGETGGRLLELLGRSVNLSVHRAGPTSRYQKQRSLSFLSSYMSMGRRGGYGTTNAFRAFEDRLTNDNCESLNATAANAESSQMSVDDTIGNTAKRGASVGQAAAAGPVTSRRRLRSTSDGDEHSSRWDSSSDNDGDFGMHGTPKRARSDNESDGETKDTAPRSAAVVLANASARAETAENEVEEPATADYGISSPSSTSREVGQSSGVPTPDVSATPEDQSDKQLLDDLDSDEDMATATAALSFSDLLGSKVKFGTGDTLICEWNVEGARALLAELRGENEEDVVLTSVDSLFDFGRVDEYAMPVMEDASKYRELEPIDDVPLDRAARVARRPQVDRHDQRKITLEECLAEFTRPEQLGEDDLWYCSKCQEHQQATKKFDLWRVPEILVVHLKRFQHSRAWRDKLDAYVDFPIESLDLTKTVVGQDGDTPLVYDLHAVCNHFGGLGGGHYTAYALNPEDEKWYDFNDSHVSPVDDPASVKTAAAYMLFYRLRVPAGDGEKEGGTMRAAAKIKELIVRYEEERKNAAQVEASRTMRSPIDPAPPLPAPTDLSMPSPDMAMDDDEDEDDMYHREAVSNISALNAIGPLGMGSPDTDSNVSGTEMDEDEDGGDIQDDGIANMDDDNDSATFDL